MKTFGKIMKWVGFGIGALLVLIVLALLIMNVIFSRELRQTLARLKAEGRALTIAEIRPAPISDDQNAAPLLQKAACLITNAPADSAIKMLAGLISSNASLDISVWPDAHRETLPRLIQSPEMQQLFAILSEASRKPGYNNNLKYEDGPGMLLPHLSSMRQIARFLIIKSELAAQSGNGTEAYATVLEALKLGNLLQQEPILISQLVRIACDNVTLDCLQRMADRTEIPDDQARALIVELAKHTGTEPWVRTMDCERVVMGLWVFQTLQHNSVRNFINLVGDNTPPWLCWTLNNPMAPILKKDFALYLNLISQAQDYYKAPYYQAAEAIRNHALDRQIPRYCLMTRLLFPAMTQVAAKNAGHDAQIAVARVGLGLKMFKRNNAAYPETLGKLVPEFLDAVPFDPFTGKALICRKAEAGFVLYSLGPDQQDDNGTPKPAGQKAADNRSYDIVWKCAR